MADVASQILTIVRGNDISIVFTGTAADFASDPSAWTLSFTLAKNRGQTPVLTLVPVVSGAGPYLATVTITRAQSSLLDLEEYDWSLTRTDASSVSLKANGTMTVLTSTYPVA
jgi:hypothetical protein